MSGVLGGRTAGRSVPAILADIVTRSLLPLVLALVIGALTLLALGVNPWVFATDTVRFGLLEGTWQSSATRMAPLLLIALALITVFRAGLWNLGADGQFLLAMTVVSGLGPAVIAAVPLPLAWLVLLLVGIGVGALWALIPALLRVRWGITEIITSLILSFIAVGIVNLLILGIFHGEAAGVPETTALAESSLLPFIPGTRVHLGVAGALIVVIAAQAVFYRSSLGWKIDVLGASPRAARHVGIRSGALVIGLFLASGALVGTAAALDLLGSQAFIRSHWNPAYASAVLPLVFLARLNPLGSVPFVAFYAVLTTGGTIAAQRSGISSDFLLVLIALILLIMTVVEFLGQRRSLGRSYLPAQWHAAIARLGLRRKA